MTKTEFLLIGAVTTANLEVAMTVAGFNVRRAIKKHKESGDCLYVTSQRHPVIIAQHTGNRSLSHSLIWTVGMSIA